MPDGHQNLLGQISDTYTQGRVRAMQAVNLQLTQTYWRAGQHIVEFEQGGKSKADYGKALISTLASDLGLRHGKGLSRTNLVYMRLLYQCYPISQTLSDLLGWSHWVELLKIDDSLERGFYEQQTMQKRWSVRELLRQKESALFLRLAAGKDKAGLLRLAAQGQLAKEQPLGNSEMSTIDKTRLRCAYGGYR